jgi:hypothetical protein
MLVACARQGIRVTGIWHDMRDLLAEVSRIAGVTALLTMVGGRAVPGDAAAITPGA